MSALGKLAEALQNTEEMLTIYHSGTNMPEYPHHVLWAAACAYRASGNEQQAGEFLSESYTILRERADSFPDEAARSSSLADYYNRQILAAKELGHLPEQTCSCLKSCQ